jgi:tetratricopeptide (TPR) repeat protein
MGACAEKREKANRLLERAGALHQEAFAEKGDRKKSMLEEAEGLLNKAVNTDPEFALAQVELVKVRWDKGDQVAAFKSIESLCSRFPEEPEVWILAGDIYFALNQCPKAADAFEKAIKQGGDEKAVILKLGSAYGKLGEFDSAFEVYDRAGAIGVEKAVVDYHLGLCYEGTDNIEMAFEAYQESFKANPSYVPVLSKLVSLYQGRAIPGAPDEEKALEFAEKAYKAAPENIKVLGDLSDILIKRKEYERVLEIVEKALALNPDAPQSELIKYKRYIERLLLSKQQKKDQENGESGSGNPSDSETEKK